MIAITAANTVNLPMNGAGGAPQKGHDKRDDAKAEAVRVLGTHARHEFEFETMKTGGKWYWKPTDGTRPDTGFEVKANGGKLPVPPRRAGPHDSWEQGTAVILPATKAETMRADDLAKPADTKAPNGVVIGETVAQAPKKALTAAQELMVRDGAPAGLMRGPDTTQQKARRGKVVADMVERKINPPPDAKAARARAEKSKAVGVGFVARNAILSGKDNAAALAEVMAAFPKCSSNMTCMSWYRNKLRKEGLLKKDGTASAKAEIVAPRKIHAMTKDAVMTNKELAAKRAKAKRPTRKAAAK